ncbi:oligosaccharide flippase family protein [Chitinispirillales bacterium ANBcel5]|uniref:oligosaccharide flippase family protein n=1 Tax=Cellulosispirillum alkaliphilum TaxID=3039283 RepID=UPI002A532A71|nr:oligosaccharide flippase family protein [Chitinispirillales bacterium ANBcel5]
MRQAENIKKRAVTGLRWTAGMTVLSALIGPLLQVVKARYMLASELASVAMFMLVYGFLQVIENAGMQETLIQKKNLTQAEKSTLFLLSVIMGLSGVTIMVFTASILEQKTNVPGTAKLLVYGSPLFFFAQVNQFFRSLLHRELIYKGPSIIVIAQRSLTLIFLLVFFMLNMGALSVVYAMLISTFISTVGLIVLVFRLGVFKPQKSIDLSILSYFFSFGVPVALKRIFTYFTRRSDELFIAVTLAPEVLGYYHLAKETLDKIITLVSSSFSKILLPLFSRINGSRKNLGKAYKNITLAVSYTGIPIFVGICLTASNLVPAIFGENWSEAILPFQVLSIAAIPTVLTANLATSLLYSVGKSKRVLILDVIINSMYLTVLYIYGPIGFDFILFSYFGYCFLKAFSLQVMVNKSLEISPAKHFGLYLRVSMRVLLMAGAIVSVNMFLSGSNNYLVNSTLLILTGVIIMPTITMYTDREAINLLKLMIK